MSVRVQSSFLASQVFSLPIASRVSNANCCLDAHAHILQYGFKMQLPLDNARSLSELLDTLEDYVGKHPSRPDTWIEAMGWDHTRWSDTNGAFPTAVRPSSL